MTRESELYNRLCFALDVPSMVEAQELATELEPHVGAFKVGLELFIARGMFPATCRPIVLDLKLHDIPETVERAVKAAGDRGVKFVTMHVQQRATIEKAVRAAEPFGITLLGVTVLTSMAPVDLAQLNLGALIANPVAARVRALAMFGYACGLRGFVCSPQEVGELRQMVRDATLLVPGVRPPGVDAGDQKRTGTPEQAVQDGADIIVVGRPIRDAEDRVAAARSILASIQGVR
jgi:orotidine-5'-phosphate decarboxylase